MATNSNNSNKYINMLRSDIIFSLYILIQAGGTHEAVYEWRWCGEAMNCGCALGGGREARNQGLGKPGAGRHSVRCVCACDYIVHKCSQKLRKFDDLVLQALGSRGVELGRCTVSRYDRHERMSMTARHITTMNDEQ